MENERITPPTFEVKDEVAQTKCCKRCHKELPLSEYYYGNAVCKECKKADYRERYALLHKPKTTSKLADFTPRELISELRARGYTGTLYYRQEIKL